MKWLATVLIAWSFLYYDPRGKTQMQEVGSFETFYVCEQMRESLTDSFKSKKYSEYQMWWVSPVCHWKEDK